MANLSPRDPVPALRRDLDLGRVPTGAGAEVFRLRPGGGLAPQLIHGYELSVARMLDGQRTVEDVLTNCEQIGLPMDLAALQGMLERLGRAGLLADDQHPGVSAHDPHAPHRDLWSPEARDLFREALRFARAGDVKAARAALEAMLELAPGTGEAVQLGEWLARQPAGASEVKKLKVEIRQTEADWRGKRAPLRLRRPIEKFFARPPRFLLPAVIVAACVAMLAVTTFVPVSRLELARVRLEPIARLPVLSAVTGTMGEALVRDGDLVTAGQPLVRVAIAPGTDTVLRAPRSGEVWGLRLVPGRAVKANDVVLQLIDRTQLRLIAAVTPRAARHTQPGDVITVDLGDRTLSTTVEAVQDYELLATLPNPDRALPMKAVATNVALPPRSLWETLR